MLLAGIYKIPILAALGIIVVLLGGSIVASLLRNPAEPLLPAPPPDQPDGVKP